jgi:hypothetical protein
MMVGWAGFAGRSGVGLALGVIQRVSDGRRADYYLTCQPVT